MLSNKHLTGAQLLLSRPSTKAATAGRVTPSRGDER
jgi:hypothetical protein